MNNQHLFAKYFICFSMFFILTWLAKKHNSHKLLANKGWSSEFQYLLGLQVAGIIWLGLVPVLIMPDHKVFEIILGNSIPSLLPFLAVILIASLTGVIAFFQAGQDFLRTSDYHTITGQPGRHFLNAYFPVRILFLVVYELWFRGFLLNDAALAFGLINAILLNTVLYMLLHVFSGRKETIWCIPFGIVMCVLCWWLRAAWPAILIHLSLAMFYEIRLINLFSNKLKTAI